MTDPLADPERLLRWLDERIVAAAQAAGVAGIAYAGPLARIDHLSFMRRAYASLSAINVALGGAPISIPGPLVASVHWISLLDASVSVVENLISGGGGNDYEATGVQVATGTKLVNMSLVASGDDTGHLSYVYWFKMSAADFANNGVIWVQDPENVYPCNSYFFEGAGQGFISYQFCRADDGNCLGAGIGHSTDGTPVPLNTWVPLLLSVDTNETPTSAMVVHAYLGDTPVDYDPGQVINFYNSTAPYLMTWNGLSMHVFDDGNPPTVTGAFADFWFAPGQFVDFSIEANRRKFIDADGKPVNLGADGSTPTGVAPAIFFSKNNKDATPFATNRGSGGAFTLTGTLSDASSSPSGGHALSEAGDRLITEDGNAIALG